MAKAPSIPQELKDAIASEESITPGIGADLEKWVLDMTVGLGMSISVDEVGARADELRNQWMAHEEMETDIARAKELATLDGALSNDDLAAVDLQSARAMLATAGSADELGTGFRTLKEKRQLIGVPFIIVNYRFFEGDKGRFTAVFLVTDDGRKLMITDGSSGIRDQLARWTDLNDGRMRAMAAQKGLRVSGYPFCDNCRKPAPARATECPSCGNQDLSRAETFYIDETA